MPVFYAPSSSSATTGYEAGNSAPTPAGNLQPSRSDFRGFFSVQTTIPVDESREWEPLPTDNRNRPGPEGSVTVTTVQPYATPTFDPLLLSSSSSSSSSQADSISTGELVGITISAGVVVFAVLFAVIWLIRRRRNMVGHSGSFAVIEKGEEPPTYEAAVWGIQRDAQSPSSSSSGHQPTLQSPPAIHHIHSPRPFNAASSNRTLHQLDLDPIIPGDNTSHEPVDIVVYPHDSPPPPSERSTLSIRSALQMDPDFQSDAVSSSYHITDFTEEYPSIMPVDDGMNDGEAVAREIV